MRNKERGRPYLDQLVDVDERVHGLALVRGGGAAAVPLALAPGRREVHLRDRDARAQQEHGQQEQGSRHRRPRDCLWEVCERGNE